MTDRLDQLDYYTLLGLEQQATADDVRDAFHTFALKFHPDNHSESDPEKLARATQIYRRGAEAYRVLLDSQSRAAYDAGLQRGELRLKADAEQRKSRPRSGAQSVGRKAHPFVKKAQLAIKREDWQAAKLQLKIALQHDPENAYIEAKLASVDTEIAKKKRR